MSSCVPDIHWHCILWERCSVQVFSCQAFHLQHLLKICNFPVWSCNRQRQHWEQVVFIFAANSDYKNHNGLFMHHTLQWIKCRQYAVPKTYGEVKMQFPLASIELRNSLPFIVISRQPSFYLSSPTINITFWVNFMLAPSPFLSSSWRPIYPMLVCPPQSLQQNMLPVPYLNFLILET